MPVVVAGGRTCRKTIGKLAGRQSVLVSGPVPAVREGRTGPGVLVRKVLLVVGPPLPTTPVGRRGRQVLPSGGAGDKDGAVVAGRVSELFSLLTVSDEEPKSRRQWVQVSGPLEE